MILKRFLQVLATLLVLGQLNAPFSFAADVNQAPAGRATSDTGSHSHAGTTENTAVNSTDNSVQMAQHEEQGSSIWLIGLITAAVIGVVGFAIWSQNREHPR